MREQGLVLTVETPHQSLRLTPAGALDWDGGLAQMREDDAASLSLVSPAEWGQPRLFLQGAAIEEPNLVGMEGSWRHWRWRADRYFHNCFGWTTLSLEGQGGLVEYPPLDVLAREAQAEDARAMLEFMEVQDPRLLHACFVQAGAGKGLAERLWLGGSPSLEEVLRAAREALAPVERLVFSSFRRTRSRLVEEPVVKAPDPSDTMDDRSLHYLLAHPDSAVPAPVPGGLSVSAAGRSLYLTEVQAVRKVESADVYENGVIHGLLLSVRRRLLAVQNHLVSLQLALAEPADTSLIPEGYAQFRGVGGRYLAVSAGHFLERVQQLLLRLERTQRRVRLVLPARPVQRMPRLTPYFSANPRYREVYRAARSWYGLAEGVATPSQALLGLKSLDRLYEYVVLLSLLTAFREEDWDLVGSEQSGAGGGLGRAGEFRGASPPGNGVPARLYRLRHNRIGELELRYEPRIAAEESQGEASQGEAWDLLKVAGGSPDHPYQPDFVLRFRDLAGGLQSSAVMDAKYADFATVRERHLPDLTLKYLHGIRRSGDPTRPPFDHLWVVGPVRREPFVFHHGRPPGSSPVRPSLGILDVRPGEATKALRWWYRTILLPDLL